MREGDRQLRGNREAQRNSTEKTEEIDLSWSMTENGSVDKRALVNFTLISVSIACIGSDMEMIPIPMDPSHSRRVNFLWKLLKNESCATGSGLHRRGYCIGYWNVNVLYLLVIGM